MKLALRIILIIVIILALGQILLYATGGYIDFSGINCTPEHKCR